MWKIILALGALNLALGGYLAVALAHRTSPTPPAYTQLPTAASAPVAKPVSNSFSSKGPFKTRSSSDKVTWASLASPNLQRYAENLRRVGCPEETIKEIMLAEVNRRYAPQERALKARPDDVAPWETAAASDRRSAETKLRQLLEEKRALLKDLTGVDVGIDMPSRLAGRDVEKFQGAFGNLPDSKRDQVRAIQEKYWAQSDDIKQRTIGYLEPEDRDEFVRIKTERREALAKVLTPRELQDYELKTSETATTLRARLEGLQMSDEEFRKVFDFVQPLDERYSLARRNPDPLDKEFTAARAQTEKDVQEQIRSVVGDERYAEFERARDPVYRAISQAGTDAGAPKDSILQAYQTVQQVQEQSKRVLQDPALSQDQRAQNLSAMRAEAQQRLQQIFGDKSPQILQRLPGGPFTPIQAPPGAAVNNPVPIPQP